MDPSPKTDAQADSYSVTLRRPIVFGGQTYTRIDLREPTVAQFAKLRGMGAGEAAIELVFQVSGALPAVVEQIGARDAGKINAWLAAACAEQPAPAEPPDTLDIRLPKPITHDDGTLFALKLYEPTMGDLKRLDGLNGIDQVVTLIALMAAVPAAVVQRMGMRTFRQAEAYLSAFL